jgi:hypothetical protein
MNGHTLTIGASGSGKSTLHKLLSHSYAAAGVGVLVCDPMLQKGWAAHLITPDAEELIAAARLSTNCHLIVDESGQTVARYDPDKYWLTTGARNWGHVTHLLCQTTNQLYPTVRNNTETLFLFACERSDLELLPEKFTRDARIEKALDFDTGEFLVVRRKEPLRYSRIDFKRRQLAKFSSFQ